MLTRHSIPIRVRYSETDAMGMLHHANYLNYFEVGRTELFRAQGGNYRRMEEMGMFLVVAKLEVRYLKPARYDDLLILTTELQRSTPARIEHVYELRRDDELLCTARSTLACVDRDGCLQRIPDDLHRQTGEP